MSDEQLQQHQQQQRQQQLQQQRQHQNKSPKDANTNNSKTTTPPRKLNVHEIRNQDFVSRLMAATPPYLYSAPMGPNNFFFSDMLRSLVAARNQENVRNLQLQQTSVLARRPRKRTWSNPRSYFKETDSVLEKNQHQHEANVLEKPLELTTHKPYLQHLANRYRKFEVEAAKEQNDATQIQMTKTPTDKEHEIQKSASSSVTSDGAIVADSTTQNSAPAAALPSQDLVLPPPPPVWYPPLYAPYGIDPLHFFIDLRVSGHIYDRKKDNVSPLANAENSGNNATSFDSENSSPISQSVTLPNKYRHGSAFTVPTPRFNDPKSMAVLEATTHAINLSSNADAAINKFENYAKYYDFGESKENQPSIAKCNANYMLQHLPRLYSQFAARDFIAHAHTENTINNLSGSDQLESDNKYDVDCDADSDERNSIVTSDDNNIDECSNRDRDIDVEIIDCIKCRTDGNSSRGSSRDEASVTQID